MFFIGSTFFQNYSYVGDLSCILICVVLLFIKESTLINRTYRFNIIQGAIGALITGATSNILYNILLLNIGEFPNIFIYIFRDLFYISLLFIFIMYCLYIDALIVLDKKDILRTRIFLFLVFILFSVGIILSHFTSIGFRVENNTVSESYFGIFTIAYIFFIVIISIKLFIYRRAFIVRIFRCIFYTTSLSVCIMFLQCFFLSNSLNSVTFLLPVLIMFYLFHSSSYEFLTGSLNKDSFNFYIDELIHNNKNFKLYFLKLKKLRSDEDFLKGLKSFLYVFYNNNFENPYTFKLDNNFFCLIDTSYGSVNKETFLNDWNSLYNKYSIDYKIVSISANESLTTGKDFLNYAEYLIERQGVNTCYFSNEGDLNSYTRSKYILSELKDIHEKQDLNDERVLVYCQPILNLETNQFNFAESLMRLKLDKLGLVFPNDFVPLAEDYKYIHTLSKIILNKACKKIKEYLDSGYTLERISVNFSMVELREDDFCNDLEKIISSHDLDFGRIAIELTESLDFNDFLVVKQKVEELKKLGIKFYLDDFGTGYSNFERILKLPFDVIKFDRSLLLLAKNSEGSKYMVSKFSDVFKNLGYNILFEGVELDEDEILCKELGFEYFQGYKYSKPIPIEELEVFLDKRALST